ncbi:hypothetical protein [[Micrococcus luteus] ATCC 49442]|jgi:hypothetical protein|uniref:hypothetical protein n=1 Tax=[Micrococcus luteus] ATCC 49442 TaxID=2698727 RepID=UPI001FCA4FDD|nr:hypothetical protein [[Micrococcus luteus] ATCC 49442]
MNHPEEDQMCPQDKTPVIPAQAETLVAQEFYFPLGSGTDPDFYVPTDAERLRRGGGFSRWLRALPVFNR